MNTLVIKVKGMVCHGCENRIQNVLKELEGVLEVNADYTQELVTVKADIEIDKNLIIKKIEDLGFEVIRED